MERPTKARTRAIKLKNVHHDDNEANRMGKKEKEGGSIPSIGETTIIRMTLARLMIQAIGVIGMSVLIDGLSTIFVRQEFLDLPVVWFGTDAEFQVFLGDGIPILDLMLEDQGKEGRRRRVCLWSRTL